MIEFKDVTKTYLTGITALKKVNFQIPQGALTLISGSSNSGKTTLLNLIIKQLSPTSGKISVNHQDIGLYTEKQAQLNRQQIGMALQTPKLLPSESVYDNVALPLIIAGYQPFEIKRRTIASLQKTNLLHKKATLATHLSESDKKLVEIARAIVTSPSILLIDEPTANLDKLAVNNLLTLFRAFHQAGTTLVITSHDNSLLKGQQTHSFYLTNGHLQQGVTQHVFQPEYS